MTLLNDPVHPVWQHCIWWLYAVTLFDDTVWWTYVMALHDGPVWWSWIVLLCLLVLFVRTLLSLLLLPLFLLPTVWWLSWLTDIAHSISHQHSWTLCYVRHVGASCNSRILQNIQWNPQTCSFSSDYEKNEIWPIRNEHGFSIRRVRHGGSRLIF